MSLPAVSQAPSSHCTGRSAAFLAPEDLSPHSSSSTHSPSSLPPPSLLSPGPVAIAPGFSRKK
ncbi:hypothetical protein K439DRAFT_1627550 [Ramaria rubella]|nr:hypothetical protein K439DRAFT_1627550 [Ramaria rubella]